VRLAVDKLPSKYLVWGLGFGVEGEARSGGIAPPFFFFFFFFIPLKSRVE